MVWDLNGIDLAWLPDIMQFVESSISQEDGEDAKINYEWQWRRTHIIMLTNFNMSKTS